MVRKAALICLLLTGCDDIPGLKSKTEIREIAQTAPRNDVAALQTRLAALEYKVAELEGETTVAKVTAQVTAEAHDSLVKTFNSNVQKDNDEAVRNMTRRGACGTRPKYTYNAEGQLSSVVNENIPCTIDDLAK